MFPTKYPTTFAVGLLVTGIGIGATLSWLFFCPAAVDSGHTLRLENPDYPLIKPLLACNIDAQTPTPALNDLRALLQKSVNDATAKGDITKAGIYIRDLDDGSWTSVNGDDQYTPASLMKIVTLMGYLNEAENTPSILQEKLIVDPTLNVVPQNIPPAVSAEPGETYTVAELLRMMIVYSDNTASHTLIEHMKAEALNGLLNALEIPTFADEAHYTISPRLYSRLLRILYNSTLLTAQDSENALELLTQTDYRDALVKGINPSENVAHKFGDVTLLDSDGTTSYQHHDCGIVYGTHPYVICVMTEGKDLPTLAKTIASFANIVDTFMNDR